MPYVPYKKGTLLIPSGADGYHLFITVNEKCDEGQHLLINVTSLRDGAKYDDTCILEAGEHPFIKHKSYVVYRMAFIKPAASISKMVDGWEYISTSG